MPLLFLGCEGDDGATGAAGADGSPGVPGPGAQADETCVVCHGPGRIADVAVVHSAENELASLTVTINSVVIPNAATTGGPPTVNFTLTDPDGTGTDVAGFSQGDFSFTIAKLVPGQNGDADSWQNYVIWARLKEKTGLPPGLNVVQGTDESNGTLVNNGGGTYTYTYATSIDNVTIAPPSTRADSPNSVAVPFPVPYEPTLTHRVGLQRTDISGAPQANGTFDFVPDGSPITLTRDVVSIDSCNECHRKLAIHGSRRIEVKYCVTCHNPGSSDSLSQGLTVDAKVFWHKLHRGEDLPSVVAGGSYSINDHDYSNVIFPQGPSIPELRTCTKCHNNALAADADNWMTRPTREACGSCHDEVDFDTGANHDGGVQLTNALCALCHPSTGPSPSVPGAHTIPEVVASAAFEYNIISVDNTAPGEFPQITFSVTDPTNADAPYDILSDPEFTTPSNARFVIDLGWPTTDYINTGTAAPPSRAIEINPVDNTITMDNGDGTFTVTSPIAVPSSITGSGIVAIEGHPAVESVPGSGTFDARAAAVTSAVDFFAITDATPVPRRLVVDIANCDKCHGVLSLHGSNRVDEPRLCVICHNANNTDINRRPADPATTPDGKVEEAIDFKRMIHAIHAGGPDHGFREEGIVVFGFGGSAHDYSEVRFPGILNVCTTCHISGTNELPLGENVLATTIDSGADIADPSDDLNITPTAAVCTACHDRALVRDHVVLNGAKFDFIQP
jgi:OmcA/MtrC family decaheme c-type cytochrome